MTKIKFVKNTFNQEEMNNLYKDTVKMLKKEGDWENFQWTLKNLAKIKTPCDVFIFALILYFEIILLFFFKYLSIIK